MQKLAKRFLALAVSCIAFICNVSWVFAAERGVVNCDVLNVRVSPNTNCEVIDKLYTGTVFDIIYTDNGWYNILMSNGRTGFVCADYVTRYTVDETEGEDSSSANPLATVIANQAPNYIGYPYVYGAAGPTSFDCSGFTTYLLKQQGVSIPRTASQQATIGTYIEKSNLLPGDLVFFSNRSDRRINHVGIYVGNNEFIHASTSLRGVVRDSLLETYYINHYITARRVL